MLEGIKFESPYFLFLLIIIPLLIIWYIFRHKKSRTNIQISTTEGLENVPITLKQRFIHSLFVLRMIALAVLIIAIARPQSFTKNSETEIKGIDIVLDLDISSSMLAEDLKPNRLEAAKKIAQNFINGRKNDRVGLVIFAAEAYTQVPLTTDHNIIKNLFKDVKTGTIEDGTAIGDAIATAVSRLEKSKAVSKVIILITDGDNNAGSINPVTAAEIAKVFGIRIYTIAVGKEGLAPYPIQTPFGVQYRNIEVKINEPLLKEVAQKTDGRFFRATDNESLKEIYGEIDKLEKSKISVTDYSKKYEEFLPLALLALVLFGLEILLRNLVFKTIP
ncbi:MAG: VWA domain-containing protein [Hyphomicrobiales bacterium]